MSLKIIYKNHFWLEPKYIHIIRVKGNPRGLSTVKAILQQLIAAKYFRDVKLRIGCIYKSGGIRTQRILILTFLSWQPTFQNLVVRTWKNSIINIPQILVWRHCNRTLVFSGSCLSKLVSITQILLPTCFNFYIETAKFIIFNVFIPLFKLTY